MAFGRAVGLGQPRIDSVLANAPPGAEVLGTVADDNLQVGDWVLVHVGFAMAKIDEREAAMTLDQVQKMGENYQQEIDAFTESEIA